MTFSGVRTSAAMNRASTCRRKAPCASGSTHGRCETSLSATLSGRRSWARPTITAKGSRRMSSSTMSWAGASIPVVTSARSIFSLRSSSMILGSDRSTTSRSKLGTSLRKAATALGTRLASAPGVPPMISGPLTPASSSETSRWAPTSSASMASERRRKATPAGVSWIPVRARSKSRAPSDCSSCATATETEGCEMFSRRAPADSPRAHPPGRTRSPGRRRSSRLSPGAA